METTNTSEQFLATMKIAKQVLENPKINKSRVCNEVVLDILISRSKQDSCQTKLDEEHNPGNPAAFTMGLVSGHFPSC